MQLIGYAPLPSVPAPEGFEFTGEFRAVGPGDWYLGHPDSSTPYKPVPYPGSKHAAHDARDGGRRWILRKKKREFVGIAKHLICEGDAVYRSDDGLLYTTEGI